MPLPRACSRLLLLAPLAGCVANPQPWRQDGTFASTVITRHGPKLMSGPKGIVVKVSGRTLAIPCQAGMMAVDGHHNRLKLGTCARLVVNGFGNTIAVAFATPGAAVELLGDHNHLIVTAPSGITVPVSDVGRGNRVDRRTT